MASRRLMRWQLPVLAGVVVAALACLLPTKGAGSAEPVNLAARVDGRPVSTGTETDPIRLSPSRLTELELRVTNSGTQAVDVRTVRLEGQVMAVTFFAYDTSISMLIEPGATETRTFPLELVGLKGQAVGLIPASVSVLGPDRKTLAYERLVVDVRGSLGSVYGAFGIAVAILTAISLGGALIALSGNRLPDNRWRRGMRFLTPGLGIGLCIVFTLSALRIFVPRPGRSVVLVLVAGAVLFGLGYLTPSPDDDMDDDDGEREAATSAPRRETTASG